MINLKDTLLKGREAGLKIEIDNHTTPNKVVDFITTHQNEILEAFRERTLDILEIIEAEEKKSLGENPDESNGYSHSYAIVKLLLMDLEDIIQLITEAKNG